MEFKVDSDIKRTCANYKLNVAGKNPISHLSVIESLEQTTKVCIQQSNSEKEDRKQRRKGRKKKEKEGKRREFCSSVNNFQKEDQWHLFLGCVQKTLDNLGGLKYNRIAFIHSRNICHMRSPM